MPMLSTAAGDTLPEFIDARRVYLALEASWQAEACARAGLSLLAKDGADKMETECVLRALLLRLVTLAESAADALNDEGSDPTQLRNELSGVEHG